MTFVWTGSGGDAVCPSPEAAVGRRLFPAAAALPLPHPPPRHELRLWPRFPEAALQGEFARVKALASSVSTAKKEEEKTKHARTVHGGFHLSFGSQSGMLREELSVFCQYGKDLSAHFAIQECIVSSSNQPRGHF